MTDTEQDEQQQHHRRNKFTLHPRTFEEAVKELWEAEPEKREVQTKEGQERGK